jgi:hypothetical protein
MARPSDTEWELGMRASFEPGTYIYDWDVEVDVEDLTGDESERPQDADWVSLGPNTGEGGVRFWICISSPRQLDVPTGEAMAVGRALERLAAWSPDAELVSVRTFLNRSCRT